MRRFLTAPLRNARFSPLSFLRTLRARTATRRSGYPCFASAFRESSRGPFSERPPQTVEKPLESSRGSQPSRTFNRAQRRVRWARDDFCAGKSHFPEQKSFLCSFCARKSERFQQKLERVVAAGELASPPAGPSPPRLGKKASGCDAKIQISYTRSSHTLTRSPVRADR